MRYLLTLVILLCIPTGLYAQSAEIACSSRSADQEEQMAALKQAFDSNIRELKQAENDEIASGYMRGSVVDGARASSRIKAKYRRLISEKQLEKTKAIFELEAQFAETCISRSNADARARATDVAEALGLIIQMY